MEGTMVENILTGKLIIFYVIIYHNNFSIFP